MKTQLIILENYNIIVSDEEIKEGDYYNNLNGIFQCDNSFAGTTEILYGNPLLDFNNKVIASTNPEHNLSSIDYNGLEEEFGVVDVEKLAIEEAKKLHDWERYRDTDIYNEVICEDSEMIKKGILIAQQLDDKKFSLEDMFNCFKAGQEYEREGGFIQPDAHGFIQQLLKSKKIFNIEVEMKTISTVPFSENAPDRDRGYRDIPKITNNKIKILSHVERL